MLTAPSSVHGGGGGCRRAAAERRMRPSRILMDAPILDDDLCFPEAVEDFAIEYLIAEPGIEVLAVSILPGRSRFNEGRHCADSGSPVPDLLGNEPWTIVRPDDGRRPTQDEQIGERIDNAGRVELADDAHRQDGIVLAHYALGCRLIKS